MEKAEIVKFLETPVGQWLQDEELYLPKDGNSIRKWLDAEKVGYTIIEEKHEDHTHAIIKLKDIADDSQQWAFTYVLSLIAMKNFILNNVKGEDKIL